MSQITANTNTIPPTTPPMIAAVGILTVVFKLEFEVGDEVPVVVDILDRGKPHLEGNNASYLVPPTTRNTSTDSRRTGVDSEL